MVIDTTTTPANLSGLRALLTWAPAAFGAVWDARDIEDEGVWVRVGMVQSPINNPPVFFNPPRPLPVVTPAPACKSTLLKASGVDYSTGGIPRAGDSGAPGFALGLGLAAVVGAIVVRSATKSLP